jgi:hypothetical protein
MKRKHLAAMAAVLVVASAFLFGFIPNEWMGYSATKTADALIHTGAGYFYGFVVKTDGTNSVTLQIYDGTTTGGTRIGPDFLCVTSSTNRMCVFGTGDLPIPFSTGLYVDITSSDTTPDYTVFYRGQ